MSYISSAPEIWLGDTTANKYVKTYFNGFVDISGGDLLVRTGTIYNDNFANRLSGIDASLNIIKSSLSSNSANSVTIAGTTLNANNQTITFFQTYYQQQLHMMGLFTQVRGWE